jgi:hypothetical protein
VRPVSAIDDLHKAVTGEMSGRATKIEVPQGTDRITLKIQRVKA